MTHLLEVDGLTKRYSTRREILGEGSNNSASSITAVDSVSFRIAQGETLGLVGQSGSGKTTVGKLVLKLEKPTSGRVIFEDLDVCQLKGKQLMLFRSKVQMIFQDPYESLDPRFSVKNSLAEPLVAQGVRDEPKKRSLIDEVLSRVGLTPPERFYGLRPHQLSGGQRQRVAIARALILRPKLIVADEPVSMLDVSVSAGILNLMLELRHSMGIAYLFITHNLAHAAYFCDRICVMNQGRIVEQGDANQILTTPRDQCTKKLIASIPLYTQKGASSMNENV